MKKINSRQYGLFWVINLIALFCISLSIYSQTKSKCTETITINEKEYQLSDRWCGKKLKQSDLADAKKLVKLPDELTFEDSRIYVLPQTRDALTKMQKAAAKDSIHLLVDSGFRSVWYQTKIVKRRLEQGEKFEKIISFVAPPGYSEHHTGRAVDLVPSEARFAHTKAYKWLKKHAADFDFYETYPEDSTGLVPWESWHWVYRPK